MTPLSDTLSDTPVRKQGKEEWYDRITRDELLPKKVVFKKINSSILMQNSNFSGIAQKPMFEVYEKCHKK